MMSKKSTGKKDTSSKSAMAEAVLESPIDTIIFSLIAIAVGIIFILSQNTNTPIAREEAVSYSGELLRYETGKNYRTLVFADGEKFDVYPHTEGYQLDEALNSLESGTMLYLLINPNNDYVAEIKTNDYELLNFENSQRNIAYDDGYVYIGIFMCAAGIFLIIYAFALSTHRHYESEKRKKRSKHRADGHNDRAIRYADSGKSKILLKAKADEYEIVYRRRKSVNELVINGQVYDEKPCVIEFEHSLTATLNDHHFEVGLDSESYSYIMFDGNKIAEKKRII